MKRNQKVIAFLFACLALSVTSAGAETGIKFGVKGGLGMYNFSGDAAWSVSADRKTSPVFGLLAEIPAGRNLAIQPEVNYLTKGAEWTHVVDIGGGGPLEVTEKAKLTYVQIPVLFKYSLPVPGKLQPSFFAGPALAFNMSGKNDISGYGDRRDGDKDIANVKSTDFSAVVGAALSFPLGKMTGAIGVRYDKSFGKAFDDIDPVSIPENEVAFVRGEVEFWDPDVAEYTSEALDLTNGGFSFEFLLTFPLGTN